MKNIILISLLSLLNANTIEKIIINGNEITKDSTILNLISHSPGDSVNINQAIEDQANLFNSGLFYDAIIYPDSSSYYIFVFEKPKILIRPSIDKDDILGWSYGGSLLLNNIKGENKKLKISALAGASNIFDIKYCNPRTNYFKDSLNINIYNKFYNNPTNNYKLYNKGTKISISLMTNHQRHQLNLSNKLEYSRLYFENGTYSKTYNITNAIIYKSNTLNNLFTIRLAHLYFNNTYKNYFSIDLDNYYYIYFNQKRNSRLLIKNRLKINSANNIPIFNQNYLISEDYVRGYDINNLPENSNISEQILWSNIATSTIQIELPFYNLGSIATNLLFFGDWGYGWGYHELETLKKQKIRSFGLGIRYNIMKLGSVDVCVGMNPYNNNKEIQGIVNFTSF
tara:strand:+ start:28759 stop:29949 length:1191 start_codon:yes stop_codon:yes gene_type:complete